MSRRPELDRYLARIWASGFTDEEMHQLIDFYNTDVGKKFAVKASEDAGRADLGCRRNGAVRRRRAECTTVPEELKAAMAAEENALQGDMPGRRLAPRAGTIALMALRLRPLRHRRRVRAASAPPGRPQRPARGSPSRKPTGWEAPA